MSKKKRYYPDIKGTRGNWHATVKFDDGTTEVLPVAHATYFRPRGRYHDPLEWGPGSPQRALAYPKMQRWVEAARMTKKVVLQKDENPSSLARIDYIGVYDIDDVTFDKNGLRFNFLDRYSKVKL